MMMMIILVYSAQISSQVCLILLTIWQSGAT